MFISWQTERLREPVLCLYFQCQTLKYQYTSERGRYIMSTRTATSGVRKNDDIYILIEEGYDGIQLELQSTVYELFSNQITSVIQSVLKEQGLNNVRVYAEDFGALDFVIRSRVENAIMRLKGGK